MKPRILSLTLSLACLAFPALAAEEAKPEPTEKKQATEAEIRARLAEHAARRKAAAEESAKAEKDEKTPSDIGAPVIAPSGEPTAAAPAPGNDEKREQPAPETPTVLPGVEVRKGRITELDQQLAKQDKEIAREKQNTKPTALDQTLNSPKLSKMFGLFGGQSSDDRSSIAQERVAMMEEEREMIEAIAQAQTPEEKRLLQKTLDSMRAMRRELEQALR